MFIRIVGPLQSMAVLLFLLSLASCKKFLEIPPPKTQAQTQQVFHNDESAISAIRGMYNQMLTSNLGMTNGGATIYAGLSADELLYTSFDADVEGFAKNTLLPANTILAYQFWVSAYKVIYHANAVLEGIQSSGAALTPSLAGQLKAEALVVRSLHYFYLASLFGDVPLLTSPDYSINSAAARTAGDEVLAQAQVDLLQAKDLLSDAYPSAGRFRPNKFTALALLARLYLYRQQWAAADAAASEVINAGIYQLAGEPAAVFSASSPEPIWRLVTDNYNTAEGTALIPFLPFIKPNYVLTPQLLAAFEPADKRRDQWVNLNTAGGQNNYYPFKYKTRATAQPFETYTIFRLAEMYLIRAEAKAQQDKLAEATGDLNLVRQRAGLGDTTAADKQTLLGLIMQERRIELFAEWGHRWLDLRRTGLADMVLPPVKPQWQPADALYPIPQPEIEANPALTQNPGY